MYWTLGKTLFRYGIKAELEEAQKEEAEAKKKAKKKEETEGGRSYREDEEEEEKDVEEYQAKELDMIVKAKRAMAKGLFAMTNATIITMEGTQIIENGTVLIRDNRIESIGTISDVSIPENAKIIDLEGKYLLPGFVDTHAHMWPAWGFQKACLGIRS